MCSSDLGVVWRRHAAEGASVRGRHARSCSDSPGAKPAAAPSKAPVYGEARRIPSMVILPHFQDLVANAVQDPYHHEPEDERGNQPWMAVGTAMNRIRYEVTLARVLQIEPGDLDQVHPHNLTSIRSSSPPRHGLRRRSLYSCLIYYQSKFPCHVT